MSWFSELANKAENLLNTLDSSAAEAFNVHRRRSPEPAFDNSISARSDLPRTIKGFELSTEKWGPVDSDVCLTPSPAYSTVPALMSSTGERTTSGFSQSPKPNRKSPSKTKAVSEHPFTSLVSGPSELANQPFLPDSTLTGGDGTSSSGYETLDSTHVYSVDPILNKQPTSSFDLNREHLTPLKMTLVQETVTDTKLENKLLRSEVSSLSQDVSGLLKRNHKVMEENKELRGQVERLISQLRDSDARVRELQVNVKELELSSNASSGMDEEAEQLRQQLIVAQAELHTVRNQLESSKQHTINLVSSLQEARRQNEIAEKRAELAQKESSRLVKELAQYKEKATHILTMKENLIASLRASDTKATDSNETSNPEQEMMDALRAECDMLREEVSRWRIEVDHRELTMQELEVQMQAERESFRRNLTLAEQHAEREKQLREDADTELAQLRRRLREYEDNMSRHKADWHAQLTASEAELGRLRQALARRQPSSSSHNSNAPTPTMGEPTRNDPEYI
ncbi:unnamed protein product, partial [Echinostoma caproni]|uniref:Golgin-84 n=1 Tax=Echinostoma caproni TaxID=27848 RepID=A0A183ATA1_9TREM